MLPELSLVVVMGMGIIGPAQYDQGEIRPVVALTVPAFRVGPVDVGGYGLAIRATNGELGRLFEPGNFDEVGLAVPIVTYRRGRLAMQMGLEIQRANLQKGLLYVGMGTSF